MEEEALGKAYDSVLMRRLLAYLRPYWRTVAVSLVFLLFNSVFQIIGPLLTKVAVDRYLVPTGKPLWGPLDRFLAADPWTGLAQISLIYLLAILGGLVCDFGETYLMQWTGQKAMFDLRKQLMAKLQALDLSFYDHNPVGRLVTRVTTDVDVLNELFSSGLVMIVGDVLMLSFVVLAMLKLSPGMTAMLLVVMPLVILVTMRFRRSVQTSYRRIRVAVAKINSYLQEHVNGIAVLQLFNREAISIREFDRINRDHMDAYKESIIAYGWFYPAVEFLSMLALACSLGLRRLTASAPVLSPSGVLVAFFQYGLRFFRPIQDLSEKYNILQAAMAASERIFKLLDTPVQIQAPAQPRPFPPARCPSSSTAFGSPTTVRIGSCATSASRSRPAKPWPWSATPERARRPSQPAAALLRHPARRHPHRRYRHTPVRPRGPPPPLRSRPPGPAPVHWHHREQYPAGTRAASPTSN